MAKAAEKNTNNLNEKNKRAIMDAVALLVITAFVLIVNRGVHMSWLFVDDLYLWNDFNENPGFLGYVFPKHANYFRPVYWLMAWSVLKIAGTNLQMVIYVNLLILIITSFILYSFLRSLLRGVGGGYVLSLLLSVAFSICRFSFYQVSQLVGLVESVALLFVLLMMISLYGYMKEGCTLKFFAGLLCYILAVLTHERYMVLLPMLFYAVIFEGEGSVFGFLNAKGKKGDAKASENPGDRASRREGKSCDGKCEGNINEGKSCNGKTSEGKRSIARKIILILVVIVAFLGIQLLRKSVIGTFVPSGTGGSDLRADFSKKRFVLNVLTQIAYLLGFNLGPDFMCGLTWKMTSWPIKVTVVISAAMLLTLLFNYLKSRPVWREFVYFAGFIIGMVTASSVSIRVEMRWVLGSFMVLTALIAVVARHVSKMELAKGPERGFYDEAGDRVAAYIAKYVGSGLILACLASVLIIIINCYYMANMDEMYLRQDQRRHESFIERTYGTYGDDVLDMDVYILVNYFELTEFEERNFNKPMKLFDGELNVYHVDGPDSVPADGRKKVVLYEDPETDSYLEAAMPPEILGR